MVDFSKRIGKKKTEKIVKPHEIYESLDRRSDKGPLRPAQEAVLEEWHDKRRMDKDIILKLHTGQGKTLIGLLMLQSKLNETGKPALYLCPNIFLANQTLRQAEEFGVKCISMDGELPPEFLDGRTILVTHIQKLFNGRSRFGIGAAAQEAGSVVVDDAHACIASIRSACNINLSRDHPCYQKIVTLFDHDLSEQGRGTLEDIKANAFNAVLPVPYWAWYDKREEVTAILASESQSNEIKFAWPLFRDTLENCLCVVSGESLQIVPYALPIHQFGTFDRASQRIFMSATMNDDSILVAGLGVSKAAVASPLLYKKEKWSGEKMVLIPSLIDEELDQSKMGRLFSKADERRSFGVVALVPSQKAAKMWDRYGASIINRNDIDTEVEKLRSGDFTATRVFVNRYDGIDLPDESCRILIIDGKPFAEDVLSRYEQGARVGSEIIARRTATSVEQGMGRSVRGEKDYCVIVLNSPDLVSLVRSSRNRDYFSSQTRKQIEIGLSIAEMAKEEIAQGQKAVRAFWKLVKQSLERDRDWKAYYADEMDECEADVSGVTSYLLDVYVAERNASDAYEKGDYLGALKIIQDMLDIVQMPSLDKGWYLQEMARLIYPDNQLKSLQLQKAAYTESRYLLKPKDGIPYKKIEIIKEKRANNIRQWVRGFSSGEDVLFTMNEIVGDLRFGVKAEKFELALHNLGRALGFETERPDKELKEGPDNLWAVEDGRYLLFEGKSEVLSTRTYINKHEAGQMNTSAAWFRREYKGCEVTRIMVIPTKVLNNAAVFSDEVTIMGAIHLKTLGKNVTKFFKDLSGIDPNNLRDEKIQDLLQVHKLTVKALEENYSESSVYR